MTQQPQQAPHQDHPEDSSLDTRELAVTLHAPVADVYRARELGLLPSPGPDGRWPGTTADSIALGWPQTAIALEAARDLGAVRGAELLARLTGLPVTAAHLTHLAARGLLISLRSYHNRPLYRVADLHTLAADPITRALLSEITTSPDGKPRHLLPGQH